MKNILGPAVSVARHNTKHVFHAERDTGPVMRFHFRHGYDEIRCEDGSWKPQVAKTGVIGLKLRFDQPIAIEIHEGDLSLRKLIAEPGFVQEQIRVAMMPWAFPNHY